MGFMDTIQKESSYSTASGNSYQYVVLQVTLKEKFIGTGSGNLTELENVNSGHNGLRKGSINKNSPGATNTEGVKISGSPRRGHRTLDIAIIPLLGGLVKVYPYGGVFLWRVSRRNLTKTETASTRCRSAMGEGGVSGAPSAQSRHGASAPFSGSYRNSPLNWSSSWRMGKC